MNGLMLIIGAVTVYTLFLVCLFFLVPCGPCFSFAFFHGIEQQEVPSPDAGPWILYLPASRTVRDKSLFFVN
jgi:hypothetical protein